MLGVLNSADVLRVLTGRVEASGAARLTGWRRGRVVEARACKALHLGSIPSVASSVVVAVVRSRVA